MKFSKKHLLRFLEFEPTNEELSKILFQLGHENSFDNDIFDLELTPNRGDCLSLNGIARDLNHFFKYQDGLDIYTDDIPDLDINFINHEQEDCPKISFLYMEISDFPSEYKSHLGDFYNEFDTKKINFFTDISNYVSYEIGQPTHCYDYDQVKDGFCLKKLESEEVFETLVGEEVSLQKNDLVFSNDTEVINLAGVMGGKNTACQKDTKRVLIESAYFKPDSIIGKSIKYDLKSEAAHKFERDIDPNLNELAIRRFIKIVSDHSEILKIGISQHEFKKEPKRKIKIDYDEVNKVLGVNLTKEKIENSLRNLFFKSSGEDLLIPSFRRDIFNLNDIAEEIARLEGYDNIPSLEIKISSSGHASSFENNLRLYLANQGITEVVNFQFSKTKNDMSICIDNPLDQNKQFIRTSLEDSMIENLIFNENRQKESIKLFEISDIYTKHRNSISFSRHLGIIVSGREANNYIDFNKKIDKDFLINLFKNPKSNLEQYIKLINRDNLNTKRKQKIFYFEAPIVEIEKLLNTHSLDTYIPQQIFFKYQKPSEFPASKRDLSFQVSNKETIDEISNKILKFRSELLKDAFLFDYFEDFKNKNFKAGFRFIFQHALKTLTDEEINFEMENLIKEMLAIHDVSIPGYKKDDL